MTTKEDWLSLKDIVEKFIIELSNWEKSFDFCFINKYYLKQIDKYNYEIYSFIKSKYYLKVKLHLYNMIDTIELMEKED
nr:MAG TPA: hypothetical protein [Ackermannviridae sp.]